jgi:hypothetical protein
MKLYQYYLLLTMILIAPNLKPEWRNGAAIITMIIAIACSL